MILDKLYQSKITNLFYLLGGIFITNALIAEMIGVKIFSLESTFGFQPLDLSLWGVDGLGFNLTAGVLLWPIVFLMTDIVNEYFGPRGVKKLSIFTVILIGYAFIMIFVAIWLSPNEWWQNQSGINTKDAATSLSNMDLAFNKVFGQGLWIIFASIIAFLVGQFLDVWVFVKIKAWTGGKRLWLRATGSTLVSQFVDSFVVLIIAFYIGADWDLVRVLAIGLVNYSFKFVMTIILTPIIYLAHYLIDNYLGITFAERLKKEALE